MRDKVTRNELSIIIFEGADRRCSLYYQFPCRMNAPPRAELKVKRDETQLGRLLEWQYSLVRERAVAFNITEKNDNSNSFPVLKIHRAIA